MKRGIAVAAFMVGSVAGCSSGGHSTALPSIPPLASSSPPVASPSEAPSPGFQVSASASPATSPSASRTSPSASRTSPSASRGLSTKSAVYSNARFGFSVRVPANFEAGMAPVDGDGLEFFGIGIPGTLNVYGANNVNNQSVDAFYAAALKPRAGHMVTYENKSGNVVTLSGIDDVSGRIAAGTVFYERDTIGAGSIDTMQWSYPVSAKATIDPLVTATAASFTAGDVSTTH